MYQQNFYSVLGSGLASCWPVRITDKELIVYGPDCA